MTDLIVVPQAAHWQRLKRLVLDSVSSPITLHDVRSGIRRRARRSQPNPRICSLCHPHSFRSECLSTDGTISILTFITGGGRRKRGCFRAHRLSPQLELTLALLHY